MAEAMSHEGIASSIAARAGVDQEHAMAVLDALGIKRQLGTLENQLGADAVREVQLDNVRLSFRLGGMTVAV
jgi:hypothetical protein